jgi:ParB family chromosome partitioning protein
MSKSPVELVPIAQIHIANPRPRNRNRWQMMVANIREVGLKKPITVTQRDHEDEEERTFELVCGQGRIEAFIALGESHIPAVVVEASREDRFLMSLVENIARRSSSNRDILREIKRLRAMGYSGAEMARKLGKAAPYILGIAHLVDHQEVTLIDAVEAGRLPISVAIQIANGKDQEVSQALSEAYDSGELRGRKLADARRLIARRIEKLKRDGQAQQLQRKITGNTLVQVYKQRVREQKALIAKADLTKERLVLITSAFRDLTSDDNYVTLLRAENISDMPKQLMMRLQ